MPLLARDVRTDLRRFAALVAAGLVFATAFALGGRAALGDTAEAAEAALTATALALTVLAAAGAVLVALAFRAPVACLCAAASGLALMLGAALPLVVLLPRGMEATGPGATALMLPAVAGFAAVPVGLVLRAVRAFLARS